MAQQASRRLRCAVVTASRRPRWIKRPLVPDESLLRAVSLLLGAVNPSVYVGRPPTFWDKATMGAWPTLDRNAYADLAATEMEKFVPHSRLTINVSAQQRKKLEVLSKVQEHRNVDKVVGKAIDEYLARHTIATSEAQ
jgi:hypothetical protein